jgi:GPH family glycoside/pentoside/hexuronide:cation symporter
LSASAGSSAPSPLDLVDLSPGRRRRLFWAYGLGDVGTGMGAALIGFYLLRFYVAAGLPPWLAGLAYGLGRLWDAINDPIVGWLSDKTTGHPWGPRIPWMLWSSLPLGISMGAIWWLPPWPSLALKFAIFLAISVLANSLYTCVNLPYTALAAELSSDVHVRTRLNTARFTGSILATITAALLAGLLVGNLSDAASYLPVGVVSGLLISATSLLCAWGLLPAARRCQRPEAGRGTTRRLLGRVARNGRFLMVLGLYLLLWCALQLMQAVSLFFLPVVLQVPEDLSKLILLPFLVSSLAGLWLWNAVAHRRGRLAALRVGAGLWIAACLLVMVLQPLDPGLPVLGVPGNGLRLTLLVLTIVLAGVGASTAYLIPWSLLPDAIDADPEKPAGQYSAWMVLAQKVCISAVITLLGLLLSASGYQESLAASAQPASALVAIRLCMGLIPALLVLLGLVVVRRWPQRGPQQHGQSTAVAVAQSGPAGSSSGGSNDRSGSLRTETQWRTIGARLHERLAPLPEISPQQIHAILLDLLGPDAGLLNPLKDLLLQPACLDAIREPSAALREFSRTAMIDRIQPLCSPDQRREVEAVLTGLLRLSPPSETSACNQGVTR